MDKGVDDDGRTQKESLASVCCARSAVVGCLGLMVYEIGTAAHCCAHGDTENYVEGDQRWCGVRANCRGAL